MFGSFPSSDGGGADADGAQDEGGGADSSEAGGGLRKKVGTFAPKCDDNDRLSGVLNVVILSEEKMGHGGLVVGSYCDKLVGRFGMRVCYVRSLAFSAFH